VRFVRQGSLLSALLVLGCSATSSHRSQSVFVPSDNSHRDPGETDPGGTDTRAAEELPTPLRLHDVVSIAREQRAEIAAARSLAEAAAQRPAMESAIDDPMLMVQALHVPFRPAGFNGGVMIQQAFPLSRVLARRRVAAEHEARGVEAAIGTVELDVEFEAARAFFMLHEARRVLEILGTQQDLAEEIVAAATARYAAARGTEAEVLRAEAEKARIDAELSAMSEEVRAAEAMLNASIGRAPDGTIPPLALELVDQLVPTEPVDLALTNRPELDQARARVDAADARVRIARAQFAPSGFVQLGPAYSMTDGPGLMGTVGISLPIYVGWRRAGVREARAMASMARADVAAAETMIAGEAEATHAKVLASENRLHALQREVVPRSRQAIDAALASYGAGLLPLVNVLDAMDAYWMAQADEVMAEVELGLAHARLDRSIGGSP
jgi:cobalt-zinc-cadmium efflux system outer membrane protein